MTIDFPETNDLPAANHDSYSPSTGMTLGIAAPGVLTNDADVEEGVLTAHLVSAPQAGTLTLSADGSFRYTPGAGFIGTDTFVYRAADAEGAASNEATVTIAVDWGPDTAPPAIALPAPLTVTATSSAGALVSYTATAVDEVDGPVALPTSTPGERIEIFPVGVTIVGCLASDSSGNQATGSFIVTVDAAPARTFASSAPSHRSNAAPARTTIVLPLKRSSRCEVAATASSR